MKRRTLIVSTALAAKLVHVGSGRAVAPRPPSPAPGKSFDCAKAADGVEFELPADFKADADCG